MTVGHDEGTTIRFLTDGRAYEPRGRHDGEFIAVFGDLLAGPPFRAGLVVEFHAYLTRPDGQVDRALARLDYPSDPDLVHETEFMVLLFSRGREEVPSGTLISSVSPVRRTGCATRTTSDVPVPSSRSSRHR